MDAWEVCVGIFLWFHLGLNEPIKSGEYGNPSLETASQQEVDKEGFVSIASRCRGEFPLCPFLTKVTWWLDGHSQFNIVLIQPYFCLTCAHKWIVGIELWLKEERRWHHRGLPDFDRMSLEFLIARILYLDLSIRFSACSAAASAQLCIPSGETKGDENSSTVHGYSLTCDLSKGHKLRDASQIKRILQDFHFALSGPLNLNRLIVVLRGQVCYTQWRWQIFIFKSRSGL